MKKVLNFVKGKKDDKGSSKINPQISVEITNPSGQKIPSDDEHIIGLQQGFGYSIDVSGKDKSMAKIHKASWFGNLDKVKLYAKKSDINAPDAHSRTCLHLAVAQGHTEVAWYLLNNNANIKAADSDGLTPFLKAIECGQKDCTNLLIECGVDVNSADGDGNTGLHIASRSGFYNIASLLLKEGANLNVPNNSGNFPLHLATSCDHREIVELLIKYGANVQVLDREKRTPLMLAARNGLTSIIKVLLENGALLETADSNGWTAEDYAQFGGHHDLMELLETKKKEASLDQSDKLSVQSSDQSEHVNFEVAKVTGVANEESTDSPRSVVIPPALEPPRSWDLIQSGVMDQDGSLENRKSLLSLGNLKKAYDSGSCELIVSPAELAPPSLSPSGDIPAEMRLSPEPLSLAPTPERRTRSPLERGNSFDLPSDNDSPLQGLSLEDINTALHRSEGTHLNNNDSLEPCVDASKISNNVMATSTDNATVISNPRAFEACVNNFNEKNLSHADNLLSSQKSDPLEKNMASDNNISMEGSVSYDDLDERSYCTENQLTGVSSSLDNMDYENGKALSIEIVQSTGHLDDTLSITTTKTNIFRECHSLELLEAEVGDSRSYKNSKRHHRNKSITLSGQPQLWKSVSTLPKTHSFDRGSIDAQLMCYDEALRQLANVKKSTDAKDAGSNTSPEIGDSKPDSIDLPPEPAEMKSGSSSLDSFHPKNDFRPPDDELEYLDRDGFPPPPMHFLENEDSELCQLDCDDKSLQIDVLPMPISMLTPIKETQVECDSLSVAETFENEHSLSERSNLKSEGTPNHFNVEVIVNSKTPEVSRSFDDQVLPTDATETSLQLVDDVFIEDPTLAEPFDKYFVDLKALEMVPSAVDFNKIVFPADSPSPQKTVRKSTDKPSTMRAPGVGGSKDTDNDIDEDIDDDGESEEDDPPFWQSTERGGCFVRQDTIVTKEVDPHHFRREDMPTTSFGKAANRRSCGSPLQNSEAETASASDTPRLSPMGAKDSAQPHLCEATLANGILQEKAAALKNNTERLKYELADARQAEAVREDTISILQSQLTRLEVQYAEAQEEVCTLKRKADCAELELKHLRELCACLSRDRKERSAETVKQLVDQATASTPNEEDYRQIQLQIMIKHLEDSKKLEEDKNHQLVRHLEDVLKANQNMISEKEALIAQNIADVRKLQEDTLCWKDRYEELAAKLELLDKRLDPRLIEAQDTIATLKRTIAILQQEKSHSKRGSNRSHRHQSLHESWIYEDNWIENLLKEVKSNFNNPVKVKVYKVTPGSGPHSKSRSDNSQTDSKISISIEEIVSPTYPSGNSEIISTSSGQGKSDKIGLPTETKPPKTRYGKREENSKPPRGSSALPKSRSKGVPKELEKLPTPKPTHRSSVSRLSPSDLSAVSNGQKNVESTSQTHPSDEDKSRFDANCRDGVMFFPKLGVRCRVVCEKASSSSSTDDGGTKHFDTVEKEHSAVCTKPVCADKETSRPQATKITRGYTQKPDETDASLGEEVEYTEENELPLIEEAEVSADDTHYVPRDEIGIAREAAERTALPESLMVQDSSVSDSMNNPPCDMSSVHDLMAKEQTALASNDPQPSPLVRTEPSRERTHESVKYRGKRLSVASDQRLALSAGQKSKEVGSVSSAQNLPSYISSVQDLVAKEQSTLAFNDRQPPTLVRTEPSHERAHESVNSREKRCSVASDQRLALSTDEKNKEESKVSSIQSLSSDISSVRDLTAKVQSTLASNDRQPSNLVRTEPSRERTHESVKYRGKRLSVASDQRLALSTGQKSKEVGSVSSAQNLPSRISSVQDLVAKEQSTLASNDRQPSTLVRTEPSRERARESVNSREKQCSVVSGHKLAFPADCLSSDISSVQGIMPKEQSALTSNELQLSIEGRAEPSHERTHESAIYREECQCDRRLAIVPSDRRLAIVPSDRRLALSIGQKRKEEGSVSSIQKVPYDISAAHDLGPKEQSALTSNDECHPSNLEKAEPSREHIHESVKYQEKCQYGASDQILELSSGEKAKEEGEVSSTQKVPSNISSVHDFVPNEQSTQTSNGRQPSSFGRTEPSHDHTYESIEYWEKSLYGDSDQRLEFFSEEKIKDESKVSSIQKVPPDISSVHDLVPKEQFTLASNDECQPSNLEKAELSRERTHESVKSREKYQCGANDQRYEFSNGEKIKEEGKVLAIPSKISSLHDLVPEEQSALASNYFQPSSLGRTEPSRRRESVNSQEKCQFGANNQRLEFLNGQTMTEERRIVLASTDGCQLSSLEKPEPPSECTHELVYSREGSQWGGKSEFPIGKEIEKESKLSLLKHVSDGRAPSLSTNSHAPDTCVLDNDQIAAINEVNRIEVPKSIAVDSSSSPSIAQIDVNQDQERKNAQPVYIPASLSSASVKTTDDDPALLFRMTVLIGEPTDVSTVDVSGISMLANRSFTGSCPLPLASRGSVSHEKVVSSHQESPVESEDPEHVGSATESSLAHPGDSASTSLPSLAIGSKDSSSTKVDTAGFTSSSALSTPSKGILKDTSSSRTRLVNISGDRLNSSKPQLQVAYESVHPDLVRSSSKELMDVIGDRSLSSPGLKGTSKDSFPRLLESGLVPAGVRDISVARDSGSKIVVVSNASGSQTDSKSKSTLQSTRSIVKSLTGSASTRMDKVSSCKNDSQSATSQGPLAVASSGTQPDGSLQDLVPIADSSYYTSSKESGTGSVSIGSNSTLGHANQELCSSDSAHPRPDNSLNPMLSSMPMKVTASIATVDPESHAVDTSKTKSTAEQSPVQPCTAVGEESKLSQADIGSVAKILTEAGTKQNESAVSPSRATSGDSKESPELHLTFGEVEKMTYLETFSSQIKPPSHERFKVALISKSNLPPIQEEVEGDRHSTESSPTPTIVQQRRLSKVTPGLLKRQSRPSTYSVTQSTGYLLTDDSSDDSGSEYSRCLLAHDRCPCKKICDCCTCGQRGSEKPFAMRRSFSKDRPLSETQLKAVPKPRASRIGAIDMTSKPVPKNSFEVLRSPFYAHWDYYDLDQDHPIARYVRRPDQAEFDNTDTILMKNVRVGGYTIPYLKLQTKEKVTSKMVCNFYKTRKLPFRGKVVPKEKTMDLKDIAERSSESVRSKGDTEEKGRCQCKKDKSNREDEENIWKGYNRDDNAELMDFPTDTFYQKGSCSRTAEEGCNCIDQPENPRTVPVPATPCESCDCFISDVELESAPQLFKTGPMGSAVTNLSDSEDSVAERNAIMHEYICGLQELCSNLCAMIGKMRLVMSETSTLGSTFRSPRLSTLPRPSLEPPDSEKGDK